MTTHLFFCFFFVIQYIIPEVLVCMHVFFSTALCSEISLYNQSHNLNRLLLTLMLYKPAPKVYFLGST